MNGYNCGPGSNPLAGPYASQFVELGPVPGGKAVHEVDTTPPRMPDRLFNPVESSFALQAPQIDLSALFPKPEPIYVHRRPELLDPDRMYVPEGRIERLAARGLLRFGDDY